MIIVTGATSRTGGVVARRLLAAGETVRVVGRSRDRLQDLVDLGAEAFVGDPTDPERMRQAFAGGRAAWVMLQPNYLPDSPNFRGFQDAIIDALVPAIAAARLGHVVTLSGTEAALPSGTGPVLGLRHLEQRLNGIEGLNVLHLRAGYFMENLLPFAGQIAAGDVISGPFSPTVSLPIVATRDVGEAAAGALLSLDFRGKVVRELQGERDLTLGEATAVVGRVLGRPGLRYVQIPLEQARKEWRESGMSANVVELMTEVVEGVNSRGYHVTQARDARTTTPTSLEEFTKESILPELDSTPSPRLGQRQAPS